MYFNNSCNLEEVRIILEKQKNDTKYSLAVAMLFPYFSVYSTVIKTESFELILFLREKLQAEASGLL